MFKSNLGSIPFEYQITDVTQISGLCGDVK